LIRGDYAATIAQGFRKQAGEGKKKGTEAEAHSFLSIEQGASRGQKEKKRPE